jgi:LysM repeat protein
MKRLPLSGSEHRFRLEPWRTKGRQSNNCYAYAVHDYKTFRSSKSVPGEHSGKKWPFHTYTHCKGLSKRVIADNPKKVYKTKAVTKCKPGFYKIMMVVAPSNDYGNLTGDFHFYKQHGSASYKIQEGDTYKSIAKKFGVPYSRILKAGGGKSVKVGRRLNFNVNLFSHKQGWATGPLLKDSNGKVIRDPRKARRKYGYNYSKYCNSFCVKNRGINVGQPNTKVRNNRSKIF